MGVHARDFRKFPGEKAEMSFSMQLETVEFEQATENQIQSDILPGNL